MPSKLIAKLKANKAFEENIISKNEPVEYLGCGIPVLEVLFSGMVNHGIKKGHMTEIAAPSTMGKSLIGLYYLASAYHSGMDCIVVSSEGAFNFTLAQRLGVNTDEIVVFESKFIHQINEFITNAQKGLTRKERHEVFLLFDSWGPIISLQRVEAIEKQTGKDAPTADMGQTAIKKNELAKLINASEFTSLIINHVYDSLEQYKDPKNIPGGCELYFNSDSIVLVCTNGRAYRTKKTSTQKASKIGKIATAQIKKGRDGMEDRTCEYRILTNGGIDRWYGLVEDAIASGAAVEIKKGNQGTFLHRPDYDIDKETGELLREFRWTDDDTDECNTQAFMEPLISDPKFLAYIEKQYMYDVSLFAKDLVGEMPAPLTEEEQTKKKARKSKLKEEAAATPKNISDEIEAVQEETAAEIAAKGVKA
jgi:RecA/RadA recombinase